MKERNNKVLLSLSGGLDSMVLLAHLIDDGYDVSCVNFRYGSKHNKYELESAFYIGKHYGISINTISVDSVFRNMSNASALMCGNHDEIPEGHYNESTMKQTVVPGRNGIFLMILAGLAEALGYTYVAIGAHKGDHHIYPDCRTEYLETMAKAIGMQSERTVDLLTPFHNVDKTRIVAIGHILNAPFNLSRTCYKAQQIACGKCGSCRERLEAFEMNGLTDPIKYGV